MNRLLLILLSQLAISTSFIATTNVHAANDLERWNSDVGRTVRQTQSDKLAQTTYREMTSKNVTVSQDMRTVYPQIETQAQVAGSRTRVVAEAVLEVDKDKVWRDWNKKLTKFGRGTAAGLAAGAIVQGIVDGVGWVIDEGGKVTKKPTQTDCGSNGGLCANQQYVYQKSGKYYSTAQAAAQVTIDALVADVSTRSYSFKSTNCPSFLSWPINCSVIYNADHNKPNTYSVSVGVVLNPAYNSTLPPPKNVEVTDAEKEQVLKDLLNDPKYADLAAQMIGNTYSMGPDNPEPDPDVVNDLKNKQKDVLKSDNPKGDGKTRTDPKIDTGTQGQADTTPKPDTGTGTNPDPGTGTTPTPNPNPNTGSTTTWEIPPFCVYAAIVCDWIGWTKEEPELVDEKLQIQERDVTDYKYEDHIKFGESCPFSEKTENLDLGVGVIKFKYNLDFFCDFSREAKPTIVGIGHLGALIFLLIGIRSGASG